MGKRGEWVIDVCRTCGKHATWPFCEHLPEANYTDPPRWTEPVVVTGFWHPEEA